MEHYNYMTVKEAAEKWGISTRRIQILCSEGRITGVMRIGHMWVIPSDAMKPKDERVKTGLYKNFRKREITSVVRGSKIS